MANDEMRNPYEAKARPPLRHPVRNPGSPTPPGWNIPSSPGPNLRRRQYREVWKATERLDAGQFSDSNQDDDAGEISDPVVEQNTTISYSSEEQSFSYNSSRFDDSIPSDHFDRSFTRRSPENLRFRPKNAHQSPVESPSSSKALMILFTVIFIVVVFVVWAVYNPSKPLSNAPTTRIKCPQFGELPKQFPHQDRLLWKSLQVGVESVLNGNPAKPSVFLLAYSDADTTQNVVANIMNATASCMRSTRPIQLNGASFVTPEMAKDYGEIIVKYRGELQQEGIMYVSDVNKMPATAAQMFLTICDTYEPLVEKAVIFLTVYLEPGKYERNVANVQHDVEEVLETDWLSGAVKADTLQALIARVTDQVFMVRPERTQLA